MTDFNDRIERLAELEGKASIENWWIDPISEDILCPCSMNADEPDLIGKTETKENARLIVALRNEALPLLREMAKALSEAMAENERLREGIKDVAAKFAEMTDLRNHFYYEMETAQTQEVFAKREIKRLRKGITKAVKHLQRDMSDDRLYALIELEALHDA